MKCWVCKQKVNRVTRVFYTDGMKDKARDICGACYPNLKFDDCHYVRVKRI